jgi:hypothetical protein
MPCVSTADQDNVARMAKRQSQGFKSFSDQDGPETSRPVFFSTSILEVVMEDASLARIESSLRLQQEALAELIDIALTAVKESGDSSVSAIHLNNRLQKLSDIVNRTNVVSSIRPRPQARAR